MKIHRTQGQERQLTDPVKVFVAYEDMDAALRARSLLARIGDKLREPDGDARFWSFRVLGVEGLRETAALEAISSNLILFALSGVQLPTAIHRWIGLWRNGLRNGIHALAVLPGNAGSGGGSSHPVLGHFDQLAQMHDVDLFAAPSPDSYLRTAPGIPAVA